MSERFVQSSQLEPLRRAGVPVEALWHVIARLLGTRLVRDPSGPTAPSLDGPAKLFPEGR